MIDNTAHNDTLVTMPKRETITDQLRRIIREDGRDQGSIADSAGVDRTALNRFLSGERGVSARVLDLLGAEFGIQLTPTRKRKGR